MKLFANERCVHRSQFAQLYSAFSAFTALCVLRRHISFLAIVSMRVQCVDVNRLFITRFLFCASVDVHVPPPSTPCQCIIAKIKSNRATKTKRKWMAFWKRVFFFFLHLFRYLLFLLFFIFFYFFFVTHIAIWYLNSNERKTIAKTKSNHLVVFYRRDRGIISIGGHTELHSVDWRANGQGIHFDCGLQFDLGLDLCGVGVSVHSRQTIQEPSVDNGPRRWSRWWKCGWQNFRIRTERPSEIRTRIQP